MSTDVRFVRYPVNMVSKTCPKVQHFHVVFEQVGAGKAVLTPAVDVTINVRSTKAFNTAGTSAVATLVKVDVDTWVAYGDLETVES